jgi:hypothetical protein
VGEEEAAALHWLRTGEEAVTEGVNTAAVERVRQLLRLETTGMSPCGGCSLCLEGGGCIRASNRAAAWEGKRAAHWAEEGGRLIGRRFQVCASWHSVGPVRHVNPAPLVHPIHTTQRGTKQKSVYDSGDFTAD